MSLLTVSELSYGYDGRALVEHLNFEVHAGDYLCIVGENGSGKSTLMKTLLNLQSPLAGSITPGEGLRRNEIGYLPQQTPVQKDFPASVREIVLSGCLSGTGRRPFYSREEKQRAVENMKRMDILSLADRCYRELSGGQQQRVLLARALSATRRLLLLDEPVSGLDPRVTAEMYRLIEDLNKEGTTIIMISHDIGAALRYASHILHIGDSLFFGTREEYLESAAGRHFLSGYEDPAGSGLQQANPEGRARLEGASGKNAPGGHAAGGNAQSKGRTGKKAAGKRASGKKSSGRGGSGK